MQARSVYEQIRRRHCDSTGRAHLQGDQLNGLIGQCATAEPFLASLWRAARDEIIILVQLFRGARVQRRMLARLRGPSVILIDDQSPLAVGPGAWPDITDARAWAKKALVVYGDTNAGHAAIAIDLARRCDRLVVIRTGHSHDEAWRQWTGGTLVGEWEERRPLSERVQ
jgi:hypothetical protein